MELAQDDRLQNWVIQRLRARGVFIAGHIRPNDLPNEVLPDQVPEVPADPPVPGPQQEGLPEFLAKAAFAGAILVIIGAAVATFFPGAAASAAITLSGLWARWAASLSAAGAAAGATARAGAQAAARAAAAAARAAAAAPPSFWARFSTSFLALLFFRY